MYKIRCCYKCPERTMTCHSTCERYISESTEAKAKKDAIRKAKEKMNIAENYACEHKTKKLKHWKK